MLQDPTVFILDDDASFVAALGRLLNSEGFHTRSWTSARTFLAEHDPEAPGCLLTDLVMPEMSGLELQCALKAAGCIRPIVFITGEGDMTTAVTGMRAGAVSFLPKPVRSIDLVAALREGLEKDAELRASQGRRRRVMKLVDSLTPREREVLELIAQGLLTKQIAARLGTAERTIRVHRDRLMHKMQVRSATSLLRVLRDVETPGTPASEGRLALRD